MQVMERFIVEGSDADEAVALGLGWLAERGQTGEEVGVVLPNVPSIDNLKGAIGPERTHGAKADREFSHGGVVVRVLTEKTRPAAFGGALLVPWASEEALERTEVLRPRAICATGWEQGELDRWKAAFGATDLRSGRSVEKPTDAPAAVRGLLATLTDVLHSNDKKRAITGLVAIRDEGIEIDPVVVRAAALEAGWEPRAADRIRDLAEKVAAGRTVQGGEQQLGRKAQRERVASLTSLADEV
jgi:hypothetical protein